MVLLVTYIRMGAFLISLISGTCYAAFAQDQLRVPGDRTPAHANLKGLTAAELMRLAGIQLNNVRPTAACSTCLGGGAPVIAGVPGNVQWERGRMLNRPAEQLASWNSCADGQILTARQYVGGNGNGRCAPRQEVSEEFLQFASKNIPICAKHAIDVINGARTRTAATQKLNNVELGYAGRNLAIREPYPRASLHRAARAMDISRITVDYIDARGQQQREAMDYLAAYRNRTGRSAQFYRAFQNCWDHVNTTQRQCRQLNQHAVCYHNGTAHPYRRLYHHSIAWEDKNHDDHLHLSFRDCSGNGYTGSSKKPYLSDL